jgi:glycosyltransferase involved in cell wall biosynthesis
VRFVGAVPREEALAWIGAADALLFASRAEGLSTVVREAEALGIRVERL